MKQYFVTNYYHPAGCGKMEDALMSRAIALYLHCIVVNPDEMAIYVNNAQDILWEENKRLRKVRIQCTDGHMGMKWLHIGNCHLTLQEVRTPLDPEA